MKRTLAFALSAIAFVVSRAGVAEAGSCGGSSGGGDTSSGGSSSSSDSSSSYSSSDSSSSSSSSSTPACQDDTDVVGYRKCTRFGRWSANPRVPMIILELGTAVRSFSSPLGQRTGHVEHDGQQFSYRTIGPTPEAAIAHDTAVVSTLRLGFGLTHGLYVAVDGELGGLADQAGGGVEMTSAGALGTPSIRQRGAVVASGLGVVGAHGNFGSALLGVELAGGARNISYQYESHYLACEQSPSLSVTTPVLEVRARASFWLSPFINVGASAGASLVDRGAWLAGINLGFVTKAHAAN
jgi:hypothetical protein